jgi:hypothetical protein
MACVKCFRKTLVKMALAEDFSDEHLLERMASIPSIREHLCRVPIHHEGVYAWALGHYDGSSPLLRALQRRTGLDDLDMRWAERWYAPSLELLPRALRSSVADRVTSYTEPMDDRDEAALRSFDLGSLGTDQTVAHRAAELRRTIGRPTMSQLTKGAVRRVRRRVWS